MTTAEATYALSDILTTGVTPYCDSARCRQLADLLQTANVLAALSLWDAAGAAFVRCYRLLGARPPRLESAGYRWGVGIHPIQQMAGVKPRVAE